jgi:hypothetical protein
LLLALESVRLESVRLESVRSALFSIPEVCQHGRREAGCVGRQASTALSGRSVGQVCCT